MSNEAGIAAVTRTLLSLMERSPDGQVDTSVTALSPDKAAQSSGQRVNLFLYHATPNAAWRNRPIPGRVRPGEQGFPPLALNLHYLVTAYGDDNEDIPAQELLGRVMGRLHDRPILKTEYVNAAVGANSSLVDQVERVRIVPDPLNIEEMSRLWTTFQTQYRVSAAYQAAVVLIESDRPTKSALPVAKRGEDDRGVRTDVGLGAVLQGVEYRAAPEEPQLPAASVNSPITIVGSNLPGVGLEIVVRDSKRPTNGSPTTDDIVARLVPTTEIAGQRLRVALSEEAGAWPSGVLSLEVQYQKNGRNVSSNAVPLSLAPRIQTSDTDDTAIAFVNEVNDQRILTVSLAHPLGDKRRVMLILNRYVKSTNGQRRQINEDRSYFQISQEPDQLGVGSLNPAFDVTNVPAGTYWIRIRADGVDSMLMRKSLVPETGRFAVAFDDSQKVEI